VISEGFCKVADCKGIVSKVKQCTYSRAEGKAFALFSKNVQVMISDWMVVFAEGEVRWEWNFLFREFGIGIVTLQSVENVAMLIKCAGCVFLLMAMLLQEPLCRYKKFYIKTLLDRVCEFLFGSIIVANIEHIVDSILLTKKMKHRRRSLTPLEDAQDDHVFSKG
jgi:hypothetical protein